MPCYTWEQISFGFIFNLKVSSQVKPD